MAGQPTGIAYATLPGASGRYFSVTDSGDFDLTGDLEIRAAIAADDWTPAANETIMSTREVADVDGWEVYLATDGRIGFIHGDGTVTRNHLLTPPTLTDGEAHLFRLVWDVSAPKTELWVDGVSADTAVPANTNAGTGTGNDLTIGARSDGGEFAGDIYFAEVFDGIATGQLIARFDARDLVHAN